MASSYVNQFNPPRVKDTKRSIPQALLDFKANAAVTRRLLQKPEMDEPLQYENVMKRKSSSASYDGRIVASPELEISLETETGDILTTENGNNIII